LPNTIADPHQLQQVFLNLINNAHQAMVARGTPGTLTLRTRKQQVQGPDMTTRTSLIVDISDTGVGIPERDVSRIFDPFFTTKPIGQGTGLGLSICFGIIQEHGGRIWAESTVGVGTTMYVELPLRNDQHQEEAPREALPKPEEPTKSYSVLVVDDEEPVGRLMGRLLNDLGHKPVVVTSGETALEALQEQPFDLIISDVKMPGMSGFDLYDEVAKRNRELANHMIFVTGDILAPTTQARIGQIGNPYIPKPFDIDRLQGVVRSLFQKEADSTS